MGRAAEHGHGGSVGDRGYAPDGTTVVTRGSRRQSGLVGRPNRGTTRHGAAGATGGHPRPRYLPDGHTVLIASVDGTVSSWDIRIERSIEVRCQIAGRNLTEDEWRDASAPPTTRPGLCVTLRTTL